ncbi:type II secretion system F family protein [Yersinia intermedia]|uniref:type II secretion system F family protein n=1 Tax=Yersinia intermedia TaxID=631 RepID=UPI0022FE02F4|nr:type II secretion system F family protein [Yersinia intermedia]MDA5483279.1 type II secretion system F family protein [Yersinia intermedia]
MTKLYVLIMCFGVLMLYLIGKRWQAMQKSTSINEANSMIKTMLKSGPQQPRRRQFVLGAHGFLLNYIDLFRHRQSRVLGRNVLLMLATMAICLALNHYVFHQSMMAVIPLSLLIGLLVVDKVEKSILRKSFQQVFPEALTVINGAISSGNSIVQALADCALIMPEPLGEELGRVSRRLNVGEAPERIFKSSYRRLPYKEYYFFTIAILVNMKSGAKLREVLLRLGKTVANARAMENKKLAMTAEARMSSKITAIIPFIFLFSLQFLSPINYNFIMNDPEGIKILYYFLSSEFIGMVIVLFLMRKI